MLNMLRNQLSASNQLSEAWSALADEIGLSGELEPIDCVVDALEQVTLLDLLKSFSMGFAVGPLGGLYQIMKPGELTEDGLGTLVVKKVLDGEEGYLGRVQMLTRTADSE